MITFSTRARPFAEARRIPGPSSLILESRILESLIPDRRSAIVDRSGSLNRRSGIRDSTIRDSRIRDEG